jgi:hypothetical protein
MAMDASVDPFRPVCDFFLNPTITSILLTNETTKIAVAVVGKTHNP